MKTQEQHRQDVVNYLRTASKHAFMRGEKGETFRIEETSEGVFQTVYGGKPYKLDIDVYFKYNQPGNVKNSIKNKLFYNGHGYKSIRMSYYIKLVNPSVPA
jgi:hypothetical protein